ncbi:MAG: patatin-like phospholipase family protein [Actinomycetota bacterium]|nr:MAG: NTE family [Actinomycetota bacterium]MDO8950240.1 patatin-like phospholipase family protein [Actinomycetota bacterium]MDP3630871.1 patatin-like phospholipase family protein [Actinomycetota bacterium]
MWPFGHRKLGLALGSGSARGLAHVGVLKVLEEEGLAPDVVSGTSMGALVGALWCAGTTPARIEEIAGAFDMRSLMSLADVTIKGSAILSGEKVEEFLRKHLPATFEELRVPYACVSTDLALGERVVHRSGDLVRAVRASLSVPVVLMPVHEGARILVDGFLTDPVPVELARELGADVVIAVDVCGAGRLTTREGQDEPGGWLGDLRAALKGEGPRSRGISGFEIAAATVEVMERQLALASLAKADVVISPEVHEFAGYQFLSAARLIELGETAARSGVSAMRRAAHR